MIIVTPLSLANSFKNFLNSFIKGTDKCCSGSSIMIISPFFNSLGFIVLKNKLKNQLKPSDSFSKFVIPFLVSKYIFIKYSSNAILNLYSLFYLYNSLNFFDTVLSKSLFISFSVCFAKATSDNILV